jgi:hypothetical protein
LYLKWFHRLHLFRLTMPRALEIAQVQQQTMIRSDAVNNSNAARCDWPKTMLGSGERWADTNPVTNFEFLYSLHLSRVCLPAS